jgi:hypothetical protein
MNTICHKWRVSILINFFFEEILIMIRMRMILINFMIVCLVVLKEDIFKDVWIVDFKIVEI